LEFAVEGKQLFLAAEGKRIPLQHTHGDNFISTVEGLLANHTFIFGRAISGRAQVESPKSGTKPASVSAAANGDSHKQHGPVVEVS
jgi:hypothetical protein